MVLLNQFHDVLPGSSIELVYDDARKFYEDVEQSATKMLGEALNILSDSLKSSIAACDVKQQGLLMINSTSWEYPASVVEVEAHAGVKYLQTSMNGKKGVILVDPLPSMSLQHVDIEKAVQAAHAVITGKREKGGGVRGRFLFDLISRMLF